MACIYQIKNLVNGKFYIGSTQNSFKKRKGEHLTSLRNNYHRNRYLLSSWKKYGEENFTFEIIEDFQFPENYDRDYIYEYITSREMYYITTLNPDYNLVRETRGGKLGRSISDKEKEHLRKLFTGRKVSEETKQRIRIARVGQVFTEEHRRKIGEKSKGNHYCLGKKQSEERKQQTRKTVLEHNAKGIGMHSKLSKEKRTKTLKIKFNTPEMKEILKISARNRNRKPFLCFKEGELVGEFTTKIEAAEILGLHSLGISAVLTGEQHTHKGYAFKYINN